MENAVDIRMDDLNRQIYSLEPFHPDSYALVYCFSHHVSTIKHLIPGLVRAGIAVVHILRNEQALSGVAHWQTIQAEYAKYGIETRLIPFDQPLIHTRNESEAVITYARQKGITHIIICAPIFHMLRAFLTIASCANGEVYLRVITPEGDEGVTYITHQGQSNDTAENLLPIEYARIRTYIEKGDIGPKFKYLLKL